MSFPRVRPRAALVATTALALLVASCQDNPVAPLTPPAAKIAPGRPRADLSSEQGSASFSIDGDDPIDGQSKEIAFFPHTTIVSYDVSQSIGIAPLDGGASGTLGVGGRGIGNGGCSHQGEAYFLEYPVDGGYGFPFEGCNLPDLSVTSASGYMAVNGTLLFGFTPDASCPPEYGRSCSHYTGHSSGSVARVPATLEGSVDANSASLDAAPPGHPFVFRARVTPDRIGPYDTPVEYLWWQFVGDDGVTSSPDCNFFPQPDHSCPQGFYSSGTLSVSAIVNGQTQVGGSWHVTVVPPVLSLTLSKYDAVEGDTIIATMSVSSTGDPVRWEDWHVYTRPPDNNGDGGGVILTSRIATGGTAATVPGLGAAPAAAGPVPRPLAPLSAAPRLAPAGVRRDELSGDLPPCGAADFPTTCWFVVDRPGFADATVVASVNRYRVEQTKTVTVKPAIELTCPKQVRRAARVVCSASGPATLTRWTFATGLPDGTSYVQHHGASRTWAGDLVLGGTFTVEGLVGTRVVSASREVDVVARTGPDWARVVVPVTPPNIETVDGPPQIKMRYPSLRERVPGPTDVRNYDAVSGGLASTLISLPEPLAADYVRTGPNRGLAYFTSGLRWSGTAHSYASRSLLPTDPFFRAQVGGATSDGRRYCTTDDMHALRTSVYQHEKGHYRWWRRIIMEPASQARVEEYVGRIRLNPDDSPATLEGFGGSSFVHFQLVAWSALYTGPIADRASNETHADPLYEPLYPPCFLRFP